MAVGQLVEEPGHLRGAEVGIEEEARAAPDERLGASRPERRAAVGGATILPDDGRRERLPGRIPGDRRLTLVGDPDGRHVARGQARRCERLAAGSKLRPPDRVGILLDPAWLREGGAQLMLCAADGSGASIEDDGSGARGPLVEGQDVIPAGGHAASARSRDGIANQNVAPRPSTLSTQIRPP